MSRITLQTMRHLLDAIVLITAFVAAFMFRFDGQIPADMLKRMVLMAPYVIALQFLGLVFRGVHRRPWRYIGLGDAQRIFFTIALTTSLVVVLRLGAPLLVEDFPRLRHTIIPLGVLVIDAMLAFLGLVGIRVLWRLRIEHAASRTRALQSGQTDQVRTLLVGAGSAGVQVVRELARHPEMGMKPVGFLDDNRNKRGAVIEGIEVLGALDDVARVARATDAQRVLIAIARASGQAIRRVVDACEDLSLEVKIIPGIYEIIDGRVEMNSIRSVSIEDLLGREAVSLDEEAMREFISGRTIAVTGAGGSIGSELCRQVARLAPAKLILIERAHADRRDVLDPLRAVGSRRLRLAWRLWRRGVLLDHRLLRIAR